ncbi:unnamed protein product [Chrysoparadoxa australica]
MRSRVADRDEEAAAEAGSCDDWGSAWEEVKATGGKWGGRAKGGRGVQRQTWQPKDVHVEGVTLAYEGQDLLDRTTLKLTHGQRYGLVGLNGVGKTTLMRHIAQGRVPGFPQHLRCHLMNQELEEGVTESALKVVKTSDSQHEQLLDQIDELSEQLADNDCIESCEGIQRELEELYLELEATEAGSVDQRAVAALTKVGFKEEALHQPVDTMSGGWRMRVALACALFCNADILLLDEPTNHLDLEGVITLQLLLQKIDATVLVVSHDAAFLDEVVATTIIHMRHKQLTYHPGNWSAFCKSRGDTNLNLQRTEMAIQKKRQHIEQSIKNMQKAASGKGERSSRQLNQVASRKKKLERHGQEKNSKGHRFVAQTECGMRAGSMNENALGWKKGSMTRRSLADVPDKPVVFTFPIPESLGLLGSLIQIKDMTFGYDASHVLFEHVSLDIGPGARVAVVAPNGTGKSSLLKLISHCREGSHLVSEHTETQELIKPVRGEIGVLRNAKVAMFSQHHQENLELSISPLEHMMAIFPTATVDHLRAQLGSFGLGADLALQPIRSLSGGQRSRVVLAEITYHKPHLLILDEVSNNLDMASVVALKDALKDFSGTVLMVTHDQSLIEVATELWVISKKNKSGVNHVSILLLT